MLVAGALARIGRADRATEVPTVVTAEAFRVVDKHGRTRIEIAVAHDGIPSIRLLDEDGKPGFIVSLSENGMSGLALAKDGVPRVSLGIEHYGCPVIRLTDEREVTRVGLGVSPDGSTMVWLGVEEGKSSVRLESSADGSPSLELSGPDGKTVFKAP